MNIRFSWILIICMSWAGFSQTQPTKIKGQVIAKSGVELSGSVVEIIENGKRAITDGSGNFELRAYRGTWHIRISKFGYIDANVEIAADKALVILENLVLEPLPETELAMQVVGSLSEGQARAQEAQRLAANIKHIVASDQMGQFPDKNAAEATQRIPGITIARDQGEGRYVQVRGTEARLNQTQLDGLVLPAPEGDLRTVALDVMPVDLLESIEVTKAITPDMDGDAVGGTVNLVPKTAPRKQHLSVGAAFGYNQLADGDLAAGNLQFGQRFANEKFGIIASLTSEDTDRGTDNFEVEYDDGPERLEQRDYEINRKRIGGHLALDFQPNSRMNFTLSTTYAQFDDQELRRRLRHRLDKNRLESELKDRFESQLISSAQFKGSIFNENGSHLSFSLSHSYAREAEPDRMDTTFRQNDVVFAPNFSEGNFNGFNIQPHPQNQNIANFEFDDLTFENNRTTDEHNALKLAYEIPTSFGADTLVSWKVGAKYRRKEKDRLNQVTVFESSQALSLADFADPNYAENDFLDGQYDMGAFVSREQARNILDNFADASEIDREEESGNYRIQEDNLAGYLMATIDTGDKWNFLTGIRWEHLDNDYTGYEVLFNDEGDYVDTVPTLGNKEDDMILPMLHATYKVSDSQQWRGALTRSFARARVYDAVPYRLILEEDFEIEQGNPELEFTDVWNADLMYENYFSGIGLFSAGVFYKDMTDYIYIFNSEVERHGETFDVTSPQNGDEAKLWGTELAFQKNFKTGLGVYFNLTITDSDASLENRTISLPGQSEEMGNLAIQYERGGFSIRLAGNTQGAYILEVGDDATEDIWVDDRFQLDLTASYRYRGIRFYLEALNLNDDAYVIYEGDPRFPIQYEQYKTWGRIGFNYAF